MPNLKRCIPLLFLCFSFFYVAYQITIHPNQSGVVNTVMQVNTSEKVVALTFDDGPNPPYTQELLRILEKYNVPATFFFTGKNIELYRNTALEAVQSGHEIGNHTYSHCDLSHKSAEQVLGEIQRTDLLIEGLGYRQKILFRAPFGRVAPQVWFSLKKLQKLHIGYNVKTFPPEYYRPNPKVMVKSIEKNISPGSIVLMHDGEGIRAETVELANRIIPALQSEGYRFETVSKLLELNEQI